MSRCVSRVRVGVCIAAALVACVVAGCKNQPAAEEEQTRVDSQPEPAKEKTVRVKLTTTMGDIVLELDGEKAPISTENFLSYVDSGGYDGTIFHRVIDGFMIQGGGFAPDMSKKPTNAPIANEWQNGLTNDPYTIAMARLGYQPDSATNQFFINVADNSFLDQPRDGAGYAVFGKVVEGKEVVDAIAKVSTTSRAGHENVPVDPVVIQKAERVD
ncbi:MAG: peptidyl-prolyl cis-trans isomerase [Planctomycetota bacterium]|nr:MAG: peptidyl-prolyl cis-trans isomerase [Planctomycetota bacterium]